MLTCLGSNTYVYCALIAHAWRIGYSLTVSFFELFISTRFLLSERASLSRSGTNGPKRPQTLACELIVRCSRPCVPSRRRLRRGRKVQSKNAPSLDEQIVRGQMVVEESRGASRPLAVLCGRLCALSPTNHVISWIDSDGREIMEQREAQCRQSGYSVQ